jgi:hypothetical protein
MSRGALVPSKSALLLLGVLNAVIGCSLLSGESDDPPPQPKPPAQGGQGGAMTTPTAMVPTQTQPKPPRITRGRQGTGCSVRNDCASGLSCVRGLCEPASFGLTPTGKECEQIDCKKTADCCGNLPSEIPEKCRNRAAACTKTLPGCEPTPCTRSSECAGGGVCTGHCLVSSGECSGNLDCLANKCLSGKCSINFTACGSDADCSANTCGSGTCACGNPAYVPTLPVCTDPDCDGLCQWACEESRCVIPTTCASDDDCFGSKPRCVEGGCVECIDSADCSFEKTCRSGSCETRCKDDTNCALFQACQAGQCIYVGCRSDRECSLIPDVNALELTPGFDPRLLRCHTDAGVGKCVIPCEVDAQCAATETCDAGLCKYIGCENSDECKTILGVHNQTTSDAQPWIPAVDCRAVDDDTQ